MTSPGLRGPRSARAELGSRFRAEPRGAADAGEAGGGASDGDDDHRPPRRPLGHARRRPGRRVCRLEGVLCARPPFALPAVMDLSRSAAGASGADRRVPQRDPEARRRQPGPPAAGPVAVPPHQPPSWPDVVRGAVRRPLRVVQLRHRHVRAGALHVRGAPEGRSAARSSGSHLPRCSQANLPTDREGASYRTIWNLFKRIVARKGLSEEDKAQLFSGTARRVYRLPAPGASARL